MTFILMKFGHRRVLFQLPPLPLEVCLKSSSAGGHFHQAAPKWKQTAPVVFSSVASVALGQRLLVHRLQQLEAEQLASA